MANLEKKSVKRKKLESEDNVIKLPFSTKNQEKTEILLDNSILRQLYDIDPSGELLTSLCSILNEQTSGFEKNFETFLSSNKYELLMKESHKLKSSFGSLGLISLQEICKCVELECKKNESDIDKSILKNQLTLFKKIYSPSMDLLGISLNGFKYEKKAS
ncbi:MAG: Hpt domain-containing protein [Bdellovibrionales bacterium]|nr:Hpt domain-containing protein [Bdellovibrionales bacterium]